MDEQDALDGREGSGVIVHVQEDALQVREEPHQNVPLSGGSEKRGPESHHASVHAVEQLLRVALESDPSTVEGIHEKAGLFTHETHEEMPRETHTLEGEPEPPTDFEEHDPERERDASPTVQNVGQIGISGVVVGIPIPSESVATADRGQKLLEDHERRVLATQKVPDFLGELIEPRQVSVHGKLHVLLPRNQQRGPGEVQAPLRPRSLATELEPRRGNRKAHGNSSRRCLTLRRLTHRYTGRHPCFPWGRYEAVAKRAGGNISFLA